jgi:hypothetical protein
LHETALDFSGHFKAVVRSSDRQVTDRLTAVFSAGRLPPPDGARETPLAVYEIEAPSPDDGRYVVGLNGNVVFATASPETLLWYLEGAIVDRLVRQLEPYRLFHAGAVRLNGTGILLPGESGSGKSTTVASLVMSGAQFYSDEIAVVGKDLLVRPFPRVMGLKEGGWTAICNWFPESARALTINPAGEAPVRYVRPPQPPGPGTEPLKVDCIVLPAREPGGEAALRPVPATVAIATLVTQSLDLKVKGKPAFDALVEMARQARCYRLTVSDAGGTMNAIQGI